MGWKELRKRAEIAMGTDEAQSVADEAAKALAEEAKRRKEEER